MLQTADLLRRLFFAFFIFSSAIAFSQSSRKIDSLENLVSKVSADSLKTKLHINLFSQYLLHDSAKSWFHLNQALHLLKSSDIKYKCVYYYSIGSLFENKQNNFELALKYYNTAIVAGKEENYPKLYEYERWYGYTLSKVGDGEKALKHSLIALQYIENKNLSREMPFSYILLGFVYRETGDHTKALQYFSKSIDFSVKIKDSSYIHTALHEMGNIYTMNKNFRQAIEYHKKALRLRELLKDSANLMFSYHDIGIEYQYMDSLAQALKSLNKALEISQKQNEPWMSFNALNNICRIEIGQRKFDEVKAKLTYLQNLADALKMKSAYLNYYDTRYLYSKNIGNFEDALKYYEINQLYKDSISNEEVRKNINELDKKYDSEKKDKELIKNQERIKQQRIIIYAVIICLVLVIGFMALVIRQFRQKRKAYKQLELKNTEILLQKEEIQAQAENLEKANTEILLQKEIIEKSHEQITSSITYAQRIQEAVLPQTSLIEKYFPEHFVLFMPRDRVSGDFYFFKHYKNLIFLAVADCTGHGVPGAFMSMLGVAYLNELVRKPEIQSAAELLDELRNHIKNSLQQTGKMGEQQDGMDIAFAVIDMHTNTMNYAGAHNPVLVFRNNELTELKADKMPVGIYPNEQPFTNQYLTLQKGDQLYLYTDGYYSQFSHITKMPMKARYFRDLLTSLHTLSNNEQKQQLENRFEQWRGTEAQVDDVLVVGLKI
jgi:serine phosphatase RsbU (regulator of sigma subunit)